MIGICKRICSPEGVLNGSCGRYGVLCNLWLGLAVSKSSVRKRAPRFPRFILLGSGALLVVSALGIVYDWHL